MDECDAVVVLAAQILEKITLGDGTVVNLPNTIPTNTETKTSA